MPSMTDEAQQNDAIISVRDLRLRFGEREILHGISFDVRRYETLVILGGSGSGKSTLLRALVSLEKPSAGEIWVKGKNIAQVSGAEMDEIQIGRASCRERWGSGVVEVSEKRKGHQ